MSTLVKPYTDEQLIEALIVLVDIYCKDTETSESRRHEIPFITFVERMRPQMGFLTPNMIEAGCNPAACKFLHSLLETTTGVSQLMSIWPFAVLNNRKQTVPLTALSYMVMLRWADGVVAPISVYTHRDVLQGDLSDASVISLVLTRADTLVQRIAAISLNGIHDANVGLQGVLDNETLMFLRKLVDQRNMMLPETVIPRLYALLTLLDAFCPETIPEAMKRLVLERAAAADSTATVSSDEVDDSDDAAAGSV